MTASPNERELRNAFGCFATGITVVTAIDTDGRAVGVTANSFSSLSLDPPLVLWCVGEASATFDVFSRTEAFTISVFGAEAEAVSRRFAMKGEHVVKSDGVPTELGPPAIADALAVFECETHARHKGGDHVILVGRVVRFSHAARDCKPLVYYRGRYCTVADRDG